MGLWHHGLSLKQRCWRLWSARFLRLSGVGNTYENAAQGFYFPAYAGSVWGRWLCNQVTQCHFFLVAYTV